MVDIASAAEATLRAELREPIRCKMRLHNSEAAMNPCITRALSPVLLFSAVFFINVISPAAQQQNSQPAALEQPAPVTTNQETQVPPAAEGKLAIGNLSTISYPSTWHLAPKNYDNAYELYRLAGKSGSGSPPASTVTGQKPSLARILVTTEERDSPGEAVLRLQEVAGSRKADARFYALSGWPAVELQFTQKLPRTGRQEPQAGSTVPPQDDESRQDFSKPTPTVQRALVAVAMDNQVITFDLMLGPETPKDVEHEGLQIVNTFAANQKSPPEVLLRSLQQLQQTYRKVHSQQALSEPKHPPGQIGIQADTGTAKVQDGGEGELEIAVNPDGKRS